MSEWSKEHAWKACVPQGTEGSNPSLTAISFRTPFLEGFQRLTEAHAPRTLRALWRFQHIYPVTIRRKKSQKTLYFLSKPPFLSVTVFH